MAWHVAGSLEKLLAQINQRAPKRSKVSDGSIGDAAHASRNSDHNPWYQNTVTARDFTNDAAGGCAGQWLADALVASRDARIKYLIFDHRICAGAGGPQPWVWRPYTGENAHEHHVHVSVVAARACEDTSDWNLGATTAVPNNTAGTLFKGMSGAAVMALQKKLTTQYPAYAKFPITGYFGPDTEAAVREFQRRSGLTVDGIAGPITLGSLGL